MILLKSVKGWKQIISVKFLTRTIISYKMNLNAMTKTVGTTGNAQRTGVGVSPVRVQGFPKITSEPRAEEEFLLYYIERRK